MEQSKLRIKKIHIFDDLKTLRKNIFFGKKILKKNLHIAISKEPEEVWFTCPFCKQPCRLVAHRWNKGTEDIDKFSVAPSIGQHGLKSCHFYIKKGFFLKNVPSGDVDRIYF